MESLITNTINSCPACLLDSPAPMFTLQSDTMRPARMFKVYDGDTFRLSVLLDSSGEPCSFKCRLSHVDTPEMRGSDAHEKRLAAVARDRVRELGDGKIVAARFGKTDKYGRYLVEVWLPDGRALHEVLLNEGLAFPYKGGAKNSDWSKVKQ